MAAGYQQQDRFFLDVVEKYYNENSMFALKNKSFHLAELGNDAGIYGAVRMVLLNRRREKMIRLEQEPLRTHTTFRIGGPAAYYLLPEREEEIIEALDFAKRKRTFLLCDWKGK